MLTITLHATAVNSPGIAVFTGSDPAIGTAVVNRDFQTLPAAAPGSTGAETFFSIRNTGQIDLHLSSAFLAGNDADSFILSPPPVSTLAPGETTSLGIRFRPSAGGVCRAYVVLPSDAANNSRFYLAVTSTAPGPLLQLSGPDGSSLASRAVMAWGEEYAYQNRIPADLAAVTAVISNEGRGFVIRADGTVATWGGGSKAQEIPAGLRGVTQFALVWDEMVALKSDGTVVAWGDQNEILGVPAGLNGVIAIAAGSDMVGNNFALALKRDGTVTGWGASGTAGVQIPANLAGVTAISAAGVHAIALKSDGTIVDWGSPSITAPADLTQVTAIEATRFGGLALKADGSIVSWTNNTPAGSPFSDNGSPIVALGGGDLVATAIRADGTVALAGDSNSYGELAEPRFPHRALDIQSHFSNLLEIYDSRVDLGTADPQHAGVAQTFTVANAGATDLHLNGASLTGEGAADYLLDASEMAAVLAPGETTTLTAALVPGAAGNREATLEISSDDPGHSSFTVRIAGQPQAAKGPYDAWKAKYFPSGGSNAGDLADPNGNGIPNLVEYALNGDPLALSTGSVLPKYVINSDGSFSFGVRMNPLRTDVVMTVQGSDTLNNSDWVDLARSTGGANFEFLVPGLGWDGQYLFDLGIFQYNFIPTAYGTLTAPHRYMRVKVSTR